jgi:hypothetical protein
MTLWGYPTSAQVENQSNTAGMKWTVPKVYYNATPWLPFWRTRTASPLCMRVKNIHWTKQFVVCLDRDPGKGTSMQDCIWNQPLIIQQEAIVPFSCGLEGKGPEHCVYHLRPHVDTMQEQGLHLRQQSEHLLLVLNDPILMMGTNCTEGSFLMLAINFIKESFVYKCVVISMVMLHKALSLSQYLLKSICSKDGFINREITH